MTKKYIKRQITLHKLGIPMDSELNEYYEYFHSLIGDIDELKEYKHEAYPNRTFWAKDGELILEGCLKSGYFWADYTKIWSELKLKIKPKNNLNYANVLITAMLEEAFKLYVYKVDFPQLCSISELGLIRK